MAVKENFLVDAKGNKIGVLLSIKNYDKMMEDLEELEDIRSYDQVKKRNEERIPFGQYMKQRRKRKNA